ncbi:Bacterial regulatory helix-turn-helix, lysR family protein [Desulfovibrionales bacterium]
MDFRKLEAFCKVYELRSFSKAGKELFLSQPTVSAHVAALEEELGMRLLDRLRQSVLPTPGGIVLYRRAQEAFRAIERGYDELRFLQDAVTGSLAIGSSTIPAHYLLPKIMASFAICYPEVRLTLRVGDSDTIAQAVQEGELALGVIGVQSDHPDLVLTPLLADVMLLVASPALGLAGKVVTLKYLSELPWVMRELGSGTRRALEQALVAIGQDIRAFTTRIVVESTQSVLQFVKARMGVSVISHLAAAESLARGELVVLDTSDLMLQRNFYSVRHNRRELFPALHHFIIHLASECAGIDLARSNKVS